VKRVATKKKSNGRAVVGREEESHFLRWWDSEKERFPVDGRRIGHLHLASAAWSAWQARARRR
jgi:hypothetical protein